MPSTLMSRVKSYPYRRRIPVVSAMLLCLGLNIAFNATRPITWKDWFIITPLLLAGFFDWKKRPFWFLAGIIAGLLIMNRLTGGHF
jgi:hypothetical protein